MLFGFDGIEISLLITFICLLCGILTGYPVAMALASLDAYDKFVALEDELKAMPQRIADSAPEAMEDPLGELASRFGEIEGAGDIQSAVSDARRALRGNSIDKAKAAEEIQTAITVYGEQLAWRTEANTSLRPGLQAYVDSLKTTIGIRQQEDMTRAQALFVAACQADHRDISLNF